MLTVPQFAAKLKVSRQYIIYLIDKGRIFPTPVKVGRYYVLENASRIVKSSRLLKGATGKRD
jgi:predicted DNA-binding transcriptional regulator AlpA